MADQETCERIATEMRCLGRDHPDWYLSETIGALLDAGIIRAGATGREDPQSKDGWTPDTSRGFPPGLAYDVGRALVKLDAVKTRQAITPREGT